MRSYVVFSSMGPDRPGLARQIAEFFTARGINIAASPSLPMSQRTKPGVRICVGGVDNDDDLANALHEAVSRLFHPID